MIAPRLFSTGTILYGAEGAVKAITTSFDDALAHLRRMQAVGAFSVKSYNQPRRDARQQIVEAARQLGMMVVPEGGMHVLLEHHACSSTGTPTLEHNIPIAPLYEDMLRLIRGVEDGLHADAHRELRRHERRVLLVSAHECLGERRSSGTSFRRGQLDSRSRRRPMAADDDYFFVDVSKAAKALTDRGVVVTTGRPRPAAGTWREHWETWMMRWAA